MATLIFQMWGVMTSPPRSQQLHLCPMKRKRWKTDSPKRRMKTADPNHEIHTRAREQLMTNLEDLADDTVRIGDRVLTFCVACGDPRHTWRNAISTPPELKEI